MTIFLGVVSLLQVAVLPGAVILYAFRLGKLAPTVPTVFALSLLFNQLFVIVAVLAGVYVRATISLLVCCEIALLIGLFLARRDRKIPLARTFVGRFLPAARRHWERPGASPVLVKVEVLAVGVATWIIIKSLINALQNSFDGFDTWDAVQSWNRWAIDWADGRIAQHTYHYPQLIPTNWSIPYVLLNDHALTVFSSSLDRFFFPALLLSLFWYAVKRDDYLLAAAVPLCAAVMSGVLGMFVAGAGADIPVAFFATLSAVIMLSGGSPHEDGRTQARRLILAGAMTVACVTTKQAGWIWFVGFAWIAAAHTREGKSQLRFKTVAIVVALTFAAGLLWYLYVEVQIATGQLTSEVAYVTGDVHEGRNIFARIVYAFKLLPARIWWVCVASLFAVADRNYRPLLVSVVLPSLAIWMILFSYDKRNLAIGIPFISLTAVVGLRLLATWARAEWLRLPAGAPKRLVAGTSRLFVISASQRTAADAAKRLAADASTRLATEARKIMSIGDWQVGYLFLCTALVGTIALALLAKRYDYDHLLKRQYYKEALSFGPPPDGAYIMKLSELLSATVKPATVITFERYSCVLSISRARGCRQVRSEDELESALQHQLPSTDVFIVAPVTTRDRLEHAALSLRLELSYEGAGYDVWVRAGES